MLSVDPAIQARIEEQERGRHARLLRRAGELRLMFDRDYISSDGMIVWDPAVRGRCEVVEHDRCSCREYRLWGACPHHALYVAACERLEVSHAGNR